MKNLIEKLTLLKSKIVADLDQTIIVKNGIVFYTDLVQEFTLKNNLGLEDGIYNKYLLDVSKNTDFKHIYINKDAEKVLTIDVNTFIKNIKELLKYTSKDDFRPAIQSIYFDAEQNCMVATDAHRLKTLPLINKVEKSFMIRNSINIKDIETLCKYYNTEKLNIHLDSERVYIEGNDFIYNIKLVNEKFPNFTSVMNLNKTKKIIIKGTKEELERYKKLNKSLDGSLHRGFVNLEKKEVSFIDMDLNELMKLNIEIEEGEYNFRYDNSTIIMPINSSSLDRLTCYDFGFNVDFLLETKQMSFYVNENLNSNIVIENTIEKDKPTKKKKFDPKDLRKMLAGALNEYIKNKNSQEQCNGFIEGFETACDLLERLYV
jgi:hypothetical protein